jgi:hypothetical protein
MLDKCIWSCLKSTKTFWMKISKKIIVNHPSVETIRCKRNRCHRDAHLTAPACQGLNCWCSCIGDTTAVADNTGEAVAGSV